MDLLSLSRHFRCMPGQGDLPLADFFDALEATGYLDPLSLAIFNDRFRSGGARRVVLNGQRSLIARRPEPEPYRRNGKRAAADAMGRYRLHRVCR